MKRMRGGGMTGGTASKSAPSKGGTTAKGPGGSMAASKASTAGNKSGVGGGGGGGGGNSGNRGSSVGAKVGANSGSQPKGAGNKSGVGGGGGGGGGRFGSRGSSVGSPVGKKSGAQAPAARPSRPLGGTNPMASQGPSFKGPMAAAKANREVTRQGFTNRVLKNPAMAKVAVPGDITDQRKLTGPFDPRDPKYQTYDRRTKTYTPFNPNKPRTRADVSKQIKVNKDVRDAMGRDLYRTMGQFDKMATPREISERVAMNRARNDVLNTRAEAMRAAEMRANFRALPSYSREISESLPNVPVGTGGRVSIMGNYAHGGLVKPKKKKK